jgi:hypothetical protein
VIDGADKRATAMKKKCKKKSTQARAEAAHVVASRCLGDVLLLSGQTLASKTHYADNILLHAQA